MPNTTLKVPTPSGDKNIEVSPGRPLFIVGRNGTGKSAMVHNFASRLGATVTYLPGARPSYFDQESLSIAPSARKQLIQNLRALDPQPQTRWKSPTGTSRNEIAIHDLSAAETQFKLDAANEIVRDGKDSAAIARLQARTSPLDRVNAILEQANLPVRVEIVANELRAKRGSTNYSIAKMSDGERIALVLISEVVAAPQSSIFVIDEPELHLHRAIVVPLVSSLIRERVDSTFIVSTHELDLINACPESSIVIVRGCTWSGDTITGWDLDTILDSTQVPEDIRIDLLGSRSKILFVEGSITSLDSALYPLLIPNTSVRSRGNCREVERAVTGLRALQDLHHTEAYGMVDGDGMSAEQMTDFELKHIFPLPFYSVEALYYSEESIASVAKRQGETFGREPSELVNEARKEGLEAIDCDVMIHFASRVAERQLRDQFLERMPSRNTLTAPGTTSIQVTLQSPYPAEHRLITELHASGDLASIVARYPIRESRVLDAVAKALKFTGRADYETAVIGRVVSDENLRNALHAKLGALAAQLN